MRIHWAAISITAFIASATALTKQIPFTKDIEQADISIQADNSDAPVISLLRKLVSIPSISNDEGEVGTYLTSYLQSLNYTVTEQRVSSTEMDSRRNIIAHKGPYPTAAKIILTSHIDTVPPFLEPKENETMLYGRGTSDAKGCVASMIIAMEELIADDKITKRQIEDIALVFVVGEEVTGDGMEHVSRNIDFRPESVIFGEPTEGKIAVGHKGLLVFDMKASGKAAHSGYPELGVSAINRMIDVLAKLKNHNWPIDDRLGNSTLNIGILQGGAAQNVIPESAYAKLSIRATVPAAELKKTVIDLVDNAEGIEIVWKGIEIDPVVTDTVEGFDTVTVNYSTDIPHTRWKGNYKKYLYGGGSILVAHGANEYILKSSLKQAVKDYKTLIMHSLEKDLV